MGLGLTKPQKLYGFGFPNIAPHIYNSILALSLQSMWDFFTTLFIVFSEIFNKFIITFSLHSLRGGGMSFPHLINYHLSSERRTTVHDIWLNHGPNLLIRIRIVLAALVRKYQFCNSNDYGQFCLGNCSNEDVNYEGVKESIIPYCI